MTADDQKAPLLYTSEQTAEMLNISTKTLREFVRAGEIAYIPLGKGLTKPRLGFHIDDINDFIRHRRTRECPPPPSRRTRVTNVSPAPQTFTDIMARRKLREEEKAAKARGSK